MRQATISIAIFTAVAAVFFLTGTHSSQAVTLQELMTGSSRLLAPGTYTINGRNMRCGNTQTLVSSDFWDYGGSLPDVIIVNPDKMRRLPWRTQLFVYHHECAHQSVGSDEIAADCQAIRTGKEEGWLRARDVENVCNSLFIHSRGDRYHPPGPQRCEYLRQCFNGQTPPRGHFTTESAIDMLNRR